MRARTLTVAIVAATLAAVAAAGQADEPPADGDGNLLLGGGAAGSEGGDGAGDEISLEDPLSGYVVTTGAKRRQRTSASLATISVLTLAEVDAAPYLYLGDLLALLPGFDARWGMMQRYYVGVRGLGSTTALNSRVLLLWDGIPMNDPFTGELSAGHFIPLVDVERIEAIRGAGSSMYGANAFSGVVNVVNRDPTELVPREGVRASLLAGSFFTSRLQVAADETAAGTHIGASVEAFRTDGPFPRVERATPEGVAIFKNDWVESVAAEAHVARAGVELRAQYIYGDRGRPGTFITDSEGHMRGCENCHSPTEWGRGQKYPATSHSCGNCHASPQDRETVHRGNVALLYHRWLGKGFKLSANAYDNEYRTEYFTLKEGDYLALAPERVQLDQRASGAELHLSHAWGDRNDFVIGGEVRRTEAASQLLLTPDGEQRAALANVAAFVEDEIEPVPWVAMTVGARFDVSTLHGSAFSPRGGVVLRPTERLTLRLQAARAFRNPSLSELYVYERRGKYTVLGSAELQPEWISSLEAGVNYAFAPRERLMVRMAAVGYWNETSDLIGITSTSSDVATFVNQESATIRGAELEAEVELRAKPRVRASVNYSVQRAESTEGELLPYAPQHKGNATFMAHQGRWGVLVRLRVVGERWDDMRIPLEPFATLDASAQVGLGSGLVLQLWANNLSGDEQPESLGIPRAPRSFFVSVGYARD